MEDFKRRAKLVEIEWRDPVADVLPVQHQPLGHQRLERFTQRRLRDVEHFAKRLLVNTLARRQLAFFDHDAQARRNLGRHA